MSDKAVFAVPELLEAILFELPPRDLLLTQRLCKAFRDATQSSVRIQEKLFFKARTGFLVYDDAGNCTAADGTPHDSKRIINPFLERIMDLSGGTSSSDGDGDPSCLGYHQCHAANPATGLANVLSSFGVKHDFRCIRRIFMKILKETSATSL